MDKLSAGLRVYRFSKANSSRSGIKKGCGLVEGVFIVIAAFVFVTTIVKMSLKHAERIEMIKCGYPLDETARKKEDGFIDYSSRENGPY